MAPCVTWIHKPYGFPMVFPPRHGSLQVCSLNLGKRISHHRFSQQKKLHKNKKHQMVKNTFVQANLCPGPKKWCLPRTQNGAKRLFWLEFFGLCFGSGFQSLQKLEVITGFINSRSGKGKYIIHSKAWKIDGYRPHGGRWFERSFSDQKMGDGCRCRFQPLIVQGVSGFWYDWNLGN